MCIRDRNRASFFGRVNYKLMDRYMLTASLRADGSSVFAPGKKWGYFPSVALAWRINEENFPVSYTHLFLNMKVIFLANWYSRL